MSVELGERGASSSPKCSKCMISLMGKEYLMQNARKFCVNCYESIYCNSCHLCRHVILTNQRDIAYKEMHFHEDCFTCLGCSKQLANESFIHKDGKFMCGACYEDKFSPKCQTCGNSFKPGVKRMEYKGKSYHESCFCCSACNDVIGQQSFVKVDDDVYCKGCYECKLAKKCAACEKVITTTGVVYRDENYHSDCFVCVGCDQNLAREQFVTHEDQPYCLQCHKTNFSKKCFKCEDAISGLGGSKMMVFEDYQWHFDCFKCEACKTPLEGQGFILNDDNTYCTECQI